VRRNAPYHGNGVHMPCAAVYCGCDPYRTLSLLLLRDVRLQGCGCTSLEAATDHVASIPHLYTARVKNHRRSLAFGYKETLLNIVIMKSRRQSHQRSCEPVYMSLSISLLSTSESKIKCPSACVPSLVGRSGSVCVVKRQKSIYNAQ
jgi:hypothetical protein